MKDLDCNKKIKLKNSIDSLGYIIQKNSKYKDMFWIKLYSKYGEKWFFEKIELLNKNEIIII